MLKNSFLAARSSSSFTLVHCVRQLNGHHHNDLGRQACLIALRHLPKPSAYSDNLAAAIQIHG